MLLAYALASLTVFLLVLALWQGLAWRVETDPTDRALALRASVRFAAAGAVVGAAALAARLLA